MEKWFWEDLDAEELDDEIALAKGVIEEALKDGSLSATTRQSVIDYYKSLFKTVQINCFSKDKTFFYIIIEKGSRTL